jgi:hypothetical protein
MSSWKWFLLSFFGAGIAFWIPDVVVPALDRNEQGGAVTVVCPAVLILLYLALIRIRRAERSGPSTAIFAICGMWVLALWFTLWAQEVRAPGPAYTWSQFLYIFLSSFLPWRVLNYVALEGSLFALLIGTTMMIICHFRFESTRWIVPPGVWAALRRSRQ